MRILVGLSGGVDSSYAAHKLINAGHEVEGAILRMHSFTETAEAEATAASLGIPLHIVDCTEQFENVVVNNFINEYKNARTPNPCIICNSEIKFKYLAEYAEKNGFDFVATGHYSKLYKVFKDGVSQEITEKSIAQNTHVAEDFRYAVGMAEDKKKDQSYMLWRIPQNILSKLLFVVGEEKKDDIRKISRYAGLVAADRADSQEICFIPDGDYASFIEERTEPSRYGDFIDESGKVLGEHKGIIRYTIGQRKGLGVSASGRIFVTKIDPVSNNITLSLNDKLYNRVYISGIVYQSMQSVKSQEKLTFDVKLRYAAKPVKATVTFTSENTVEVDLSEPVRAVTPGQSAVFYQEGLVAFGGFIDRAE